MEALVGELEESWRNCVLAPRTPSTDWCRHVYRERNKCADELANLAMDRQESEIWQSSERMPRMQQLRAHFDGGKRGNATASCGWHLEGSPAKDRDGHPLWRTIAHGSILLPPDTTTVESELLGMTEAIRAVTKFALDHS